MDLKEKENLKEAEWTIIVQKVKVQENPPIYQIIMRYYGDEPTPEMRCEADSVEWVKIEK